MKFLHAADIHLDSPLRGLEEYEGAPVDQIRGATRRALENLCTLATDEKVDFVLIAGDLYDGDWKDHNTGMFFRGQMIRLRDAGIPVVVICGNHDAANKMTKKLRIPENVQLLSHSSAETACHARLRELGVAIHGRSFAKAAETENMACDYPAKSRGMFNIGMLHTSLTGAEGHEPYAPCTLDDLRRKDYHYWALGHVHTRDVKHGDPPIVFPGNIQGRHVRETGARGCYLVTVDDRESCQLEFRELDVFRFEELRVAANNVRRADDLLDLLAGQFKKLAEQRPDSPLGVRVVLLGSCPAHYELVADAPAWTAQVRALALDASDGRIWIEAVKTRTSPPTASAEAMQGPLAELLRCVHEIQADKSQLDELMAELSEFQRKLPDDLFTGVDGWVWDDSQQRREWLADAHSLLLSRLGQSAPAE